MILPQIVAILEDDRVVAIELTKLKTKGKEVGLEDGRLFIVDADDGSIIAVVLRGIMQEEDQVQTEFLSWAVETIQNGIAGRRSIRVSTTYKYVHTTLIVMTSLC